MPNPRKPLAQSLVDAALACTQSENSTQFSLRDLAKGLGVSHAAAYKHFPSRQHLLEDIAREGFEKLCADFASCPPDLKAIGLCYMRFGLSHPAYYRVMFATPLSQQLTPELATAGEACFAHLMQAFSTPSPHNTRRALAAWSLVHGWVLLRMDGAADTILRTHSNDGELEMEEFLMGLAGAIAQL